MLGGKSSLEKRRGELQTKLKNIKYTIENAQRAKKTIDPTWNSQMRAIEFELKKVEAKISKEGGKTNEWK